MRITRETSKMTPVQRAGILGLLLLGSACNGDEDGARKRDDSAAADASAFADRPPMDDSPDVDEVPKFDGSTSDRSWLDGNIETDASDAQALANADEAGLGHMPVPLARPFRSGSRLKARYYKYEGVPDAFVGMLDTKTQAPCRFVPTTAGDLRCLPAGPLHGLMTVGYLDANCTQSVYRTLSGCNQVEHLVTRYQERCQQQATVHRLEPLQSSVPYYTITYPMMTCVRAGSADPSWLRAGSALALDDFVAGTKLLLPSASDLTREVVVGNDGSVDSGEIVAKAHRVACRPEFTAQPTACHISTGVYYDGPATYYLDDQCSMEVQRDYATSHLAPECPTPALSTDMTQARSGLYGARRVGKRVGEQVYARANACTLATSRSWSIQLFEAGETVQLPKLRGSSMGNGRLHAQLLSDEFGTVLGFATEPDVAALYRNAQTGEACQLKQLPEGLYCLPAHTELHSPSRLEFFRDANCTSPLFECPRSDCTSWLYLLQAQPVCGPFFAEAFTADTEFKGVRYQRDVTGSCVVDTSSGIRVWTRKAADLSTYPKVELVDESLPL